MQGNNMDMTPNANPNVTTPTKLFFSLLIFNLHTNFPPERTTAPPKVWTWEPVSMDPYLYCFHEDQEEGCSDEREYMFEKQLTPSDVGKLNRLVVPKQHAEKHFPMAGESGEKGLLLSFEDESGKPWRFRYSYWGSSQSYVLTKGWSRFVKEKRLDAGDAVLFHRRLGDDRFCIECRRRRGSQSGARAAEHNSAVLPWGPSFCADASPSASCFYIGSVQQDCHLRAGRQSTASVGESTAATATPGNSKRLRLFGVNLEYCGPEQV